MCRHLGPIREVVPEYGEEWPDDGGCQHEQRADQRQQCPWMERGDGLEEEERRREDRGDRAN